MVIDNRFVVRRACGPRQFLNVAPWLAILVLLAGCPEPPPKEIPELEKLRWTVEQLAHEITVKRADCTDKDLATLAEFGQALARQDKELTIRITGPNVTDAGLLSIKGLSNVKVFEASQTAITGKGIAAMSGWQKLKNLDLSETKVDDGALVHLAKLPNLKLLTLDGCSLTGAGLGSLKNLVNLDSLRLNNTSIDDAGLAKLPRLAKLKILQLDATRITDKSVERLMQFPALDELRIRNVTGISDEAVDKLTKAKPDLTVDR